MKLHEATKAHDEQNAVARPLSATLDRLILGTIIVSGATFLGALVAPGTVLISLVGCVVALTFVSTCVFGHTDALDKLRWRRYWRGDLLGYWISYPLFIFIVFSHDDSEFNWLISYFGASCVAFEIGLLNVQRTDKMDKEAVVMKLREAMDDSGETVDLMR